ncbi:MAG TPA: ABC transporter permease [Elusimicrobiales bacterium]|mgnify:CR=1 FL=1|nr:ABC transporter permease [Elusimicrobiales bacterium]HOL62800.1 ABC transporter permease [Elusimicrobiales bacterium]
MSFESEIALRYVKNSRKSLFTSLTTLIAVSGIAISVAAILVTLGVINGFQSEIKKKILDSQSHIVIYGEMNKNELSRLDTILYSFKEIEAKSVFIISQGILITQTRSLGTVIKGIEAENEFKVTNIEKSLRYGKWDLKNQGIVLGEELAKNLGVFIDDELVLVSPKFDSGTLGIIPKMRKFKIKGIINTGYYEYDSSFAFIDINEARSFFNPDILSNGISIKLKDINLTQSIYFKLRKEIPFYFSIKTYSDINKNLFSALKLEKFVMTLILSLIILIATFSISSNLFMITVQKTKEIGILRAMGASKNKIKKIFMICGIYISGIGIGIGMIIGFIILEIVKRYKILELPSDIYYITRVPVEVSTKDVLLIITISLVLTVISSQIPANKASKVDPGDAIRYG